MSQAPEQTARTEIDRLLQVAGWTVQDVSAVNLHAARGVAIREFPLAGHGFADYLLHVDGRAAGVIEARGKLQGLGAGAGHGAAVRHEHAAARHRQTGLRAH